MLQTHYVDRIQISAEALQKAGITESNKTINLRRIAFGWSLVIELEARYRKLFEVFLVNQSNFNQTLFHGLLTTLSYCFTALVTPSFVAEMKGHPANAKSFGELLITLVKLLIEMMIFATKISSDNITTCILDDDATKKLLQDNKTIQSSDCRGHPIGETKDELQFMKSIETLRSGGANTLINTIGAGEGIADDEGAGGDEIESENVFVVAFYLITRESGVLFQTLTHAVCSFEREKIRVVPKSLVKELVNTFFTALLSIKHLGSIERISTGKKMAVCED